MQRNGLTVATALRIRTSALTLGGNLTAAVESNREKHGCRDVCQVKWDHCHYYMPRFRQLRISVHSPDVDSKFPTLEKSDERVSDRPPQPQPPSAAATPGQ